MKNYYSRISGCILLVALEALLFLWMPYYKGFICTSYIIQNINAGDIIFRIIYYGIYFFAVYAMLSYYYYGKFYSFFMRSPVGLIISFASVRLMADVANYIVYYFFNDYAFNFVACITEVIFLFFTLWLISEFISDNKFKFCFDKGAILFFIVLFVVVALLATYCIIKYNGFAHIVEKYTTNAMVRVAYSENIDFTLQFSRFIFTNVLNVICFLYFYYSTLKCGLIKIKSNISLSKTILRFWAAAFVIGVLYVVKYVAYPIDLFLIFPEEIHSTYVKLYPNSAGKYRSFGIDTSAVPYSRFSSYLDGELKNVINMGTVTVKNGTDKLKKFTYYIPIDADSNYYNDLIPVETEYTESTDILDCNVQRLENLGLFFFDGDKRYAMKVESIKWQKENKVLTAILENLIADGQWDYFEYGCDYMQKYDADFIKPYIERYANGDFTENEINENLEINKEYMISFAKEMLS